MARIKINRMLTPISWSKLSQFDVPTVSIIMLAPTFFMILGFNIIDIYYFLYISSAKPL
jgi:hypothetical protein